MGIWRDYRESNMITEVTSTTAATGTGSGTGTATTGTTTKEG
jgi:hypothetical protein